MKRTFLLVVTFLTVLVFLSCGQKVNGQTANPASDFEIEENRDGGITIQRYTGQSKDVVIPAKIKGKTVTVISSYSFPPLSSIIIPDGVTYIDQLAFEQGVNSITIGSDVEFIDGTLVTERHDRHDIGAITVYNRNRKQAGTYYADKGADIYNAYNWSYQKPAVQTTANQTGSVPLESGMWLYRPGTEWVLSFTRGRETEIQRGGYERIYAYTFRDGVCHYYVSAYGGIGRAWRGSYTVSGNIIIVKYTKDRTEHQLTFSLSDNSIADGEYTYTWEDVQGIDELLEKYPEIKGN